MWFFCRIWGEKTYIRVYRMIFTRILNEKSVLGFSCLGLREICIKSLYQVFSCFIYRDSTGKACMSFPHSVFMCILYEKPLWGFILWYLVDSLRKASMRFSRMVCIGIWTDKDLITKRFTRFSRMDCTWILH